MLLTKREEQLVKAFLQVGKLSLREMGDILQVSSRTVYRTLSDLMLTLETHNIELIKDGRKYYLAGDLSVLEESQASREVTASQRLELTAYHLLTSPDPIINEELQELFWVSNVTVIQDVAEIEKRLQEFDLSIQRKKGYQAPRSVRGSWQMKSGMIWCQRPFLIMFFRTELTTGSSFQNKGEAENAGLGKIWRRDQTNRAGCCRLAGLPEAEPDDHRYDQPGSERCGKWRGTEHAFFWKCV